MYRHWKTDPKSVHASWAAYFEGLDKGIPSSSAYTPPPGFIGAASGAIQPAEGAPQMQVEGQGDVSDYLKVSGVVLVALPLSRRDIPLDSHVSHIILIRPPPTLVPRPHLCPV